MAGHMEIILTEDVPNLGSAGDIVRVRNGYGRNYLLPRGKALLATSGRVKQLEHQRRIIAERQRKEVAAQQEVARELAKASLVFDVQVGEEGKLFGSVTNADIAARLAEQGFEIERRRIELPNPIKQVGDHMVGIRLHREVVVQLVARVVPVGGSVDSEADEPETSAPEAPLA